MRKKRLTKDISLIALCTALLCVSAWIAIPFGSVPVTLQTMGVIFVAGFLGVKRGTTAVAAYLFLGALGVPVFSAFSGGVGVFFSPTGGFLIGLLPAALIMGAFSKKQSFLRFSLGGGLAVLAVYAFGVGGFMLHSAGTSGFWGALTVCVLPFLPFDAAKILLAALLLKKLPIYNMRKLS